MAKYCRRGPLSDNILVFHMFNGRIVGVSSEVHDKVFTINHILNTVTFFTEITYTVDRGTQLLLHITMNSLELQRGLFSTRDKFI